MIYFFRLNIVTRLESVSTPTIVDETTAATATPRQRLKRPRLEIDDDDIAAMNSDEEVKESV